ncbi:glycosyl transferase family protein [Sphingomonas bacterium]|uniref:glycosyl transferase family protein n=1 Tax=Sphingomonas bacterium TaxID=1895847 RepID=UPI0034A032C2
MVDSITRELMLFAAAGLMVGGVDDLALDGLFLLRRLWRGREPQPWVRDLPEPATATRFAILVPAWNEAAVIGAMLAATLGRYRHRDYLIFVAAYANDRATVDAIARVAERDGRVRLVVNPRPGPTTKADNLNAAWRALLREEAASGRGFVAAMLHDAEDVVHPDELRVCAALLGEADVVQLPVLPLVHPKAPMVSGHYADEFAESHGKQMVMRAALGAGMPLAGTGCAIATAMLRRIAETRGGLPFEPTSLTEDYELGLAIAELGGRGVFARYRDDGGEPVAVRAYFPGDFAAAARQKARWMVGIALAGWDRTGWARPTQLTDHWMRMRDRRAPLAVLVLAAAYAALLAWALDDLLHAWSGEPVPVMAPAWLLAFNMAMLAWRLAMRVAFTTRDYGWREGLRAVPRFLVGNTVSLAAAPRALAIYAAMLLGAAPVWDKTEHEYPAVEAAG